MRAVLKRKQFLLRTNDLEKLDDLVKEAGCSESEIIRRALEDYEPYSINDSEFERMLELMRDSVSSAIKAVKSTRKEVRTAIRDYKEAHA